MMGCASRKSPLRNGRESRFFFSQLSQILSHSTSEVEERTNLSSDILIEFPNITTLFLSEEASIRIVKTLIEGVSGASARLYSPPGLCYFHWLPLPKWTKVVPFSTMAKSITHLSLFLSKYSSFSLWNITLPNLRTLTVSTKVSTGTDPIIFAQDHLAKAQIPQVELVLWYDVRNKMQLPSSGRWEVAAKAVRHPKLIFVVASLEEDILARHFWPFLPIPLQYTNPFEPWGLKTFPHLRLEERGRKLVKERAKLLG
ncbi:hypothetical protein DL96DRAFT_1576940 [Flagelloscypha sp. PMI_526]|nr:hypothetical protein DL96DRAFT_1576940 [Flagelloscypha sp. PMI_526]